MEKFEERDKGATQLYDLGKMTHHPKQLLLRWLGGKAIGLPTFCPICGHKGAQSHWSACHGLDDTALDIYEGSYLKAEERIARVVEEYQARKIIPTTGTDK